MWISIHAPARGATQDGTKETYNVKGFQSTLPRGERHIHIHCCNIHYYFNPRSREGSDFSKLINFVNLSISIHAPARGATEKRTALENTLHISIHAPARGATAFCAPHHGLIKFQSTLPRGERPASGQNQASYAYFNPRSREGSDFAFFLLADCSKISIHAPARGATHTQVLHWF